MAPWTKYLLCKPPWANSDPQNTFESQIFGILAQHGGNREPSAAGRCLTSPRAWHTLFTYKVRTKYWAVVVLVGKGDKLVTHEKAHTHVTSPSGRASCHCTQVTWMGKTMLQFKQWGTFFFTSSYWAPFQFAVWLDCPELPGQPSGDLCPVPDAAVSTQILNICGLQWDSSVTLL